MSRAVPALALAAVLFAGGALLVGSVPVPLPWQSARASLAPVAGAIDASADGSDDEFGGAAAAEVAGTTPAGVPVAVAARARTSCDTFVAGLRRETGRAADLLSWKIVASFRMVQQNGYFLTCRVRYGGRATERADIVYDGDLFEAPVPVFTARASDSVGIAVPDLVGRRSAEICANFVGLARRDFGVRMDLLSWRILGGFESFDTSGYFLTCRVRVSGVGEREMGYITTYGADDLRDVFPDPY